MRRHQDPLLAYSRQRFIRDPSRPELLAELPAVKAVVRGLDTVVAHSEGRIKRFGLVGYSKYGAATFATAAADPRVRALAPSSIGLGSPPPPGADAGAALLQTLGRVSPAPMGADTA